MSNFKHEHILHMLGVCLNNDPQFIILELMEGGDLLSFLRSSRATTVSHTSHSFLRNGIGNDHSQVESNIQLYHCESD